MNQRYSQRQTRFEALLHEHRRIVFKVAGTYTRTVDDRNDLAQEIAAQLWRAFPSFDERRRFSTWMYRIALNVGISHLRRESGQASRLEPLDGDEPSGVAFADAAGDEPDERLAELHAFIAQLDALNRALILLYLEDRAYVEIAEILGISETNVATKISRIKQQARQRMTGAYPANREEQKHGTR